jgi:hypothetical protein
MASMSARILAKFSAVVNKLTLCDFKCSCLGQFTETAARRFLCLELASVEKKLTF